MSEDIPINTSNFIFTKVEYINIQSNIKKISLDNIFDIIVTSNKVPFVQYCKDINKIKYKIYENHKIQPSLFQLWTLYEKIPKVSMIICMIPLIINDEIKVYAKCSINENSQIFVQYMIESRDKVNWEQINSHLNFIVKKWLETILHTSVKLTCDSLSLKTDINSKLSYNQLEKYINMIEPLYHVIRIQDNLIITAFKRSNKYKKKLDISEHIKNALKHGIPSNEILDTLIEFGLSSEDIEYWKEQIDLEKEIQEDINKDVKKRTRLLLGTGCILKLSKISIGFRINIDNVASNEEAYRVIRWINSTLRIKPKEKRTVKKKQIIEPDKEPVKEQVEVKKKIEEVKPEIEMNEDDLLLFEEIGDINLEELTGGAIGKTYQRYFIDLLQKTDPKIFSESENYATKCQINQFRQPAVISKEEKEKLESTGYANYDSILEYGSSATNKNYYFCPKIWCPISKIPLTDKQLKENNNLCPKTQQNEFQNEEPIILYNHSYWDNDYKTPHHIGFHSSPASKEGLCLPCCMKKRINDKDKNRCIKTEEIVEKESKQKSESAASVQKDAYIMGTVSPIPEGRYGSIPKELHNILMPSIEYHICSNTNLSSQPCLVRKGINQSIDSMMESISIALKLGNKKELIKIIKNNLDPITFLSLENGNLYKIFSDSEPPIPNNKKLLLECNKWINDVLEDNPSRNLSIYNAYVNFINYLSSNEIKNIHHIISLLEILGYILVIFHKYGNNEVTFQCSLYSKGIGNNVIFLYEDIIESSNKTKVKIYEPLEMKQRNKEGETIFNIIDYPYVTKLLNKCNKDNNYHISNFINILNVISLWCDNILNEGKPFYPETIIIRQDLYLYGFLTKNNVLVTLPNGMYGIENLIEFSKSKYIVKFLEDIQDTVVQIKGIFKKDLDYFTKKMIDIGYGVNAGADISKYDDVIYMATLTIPELNFNIPPVILQHDNNELYRFIDTENNKSKKWYQIESAIGKTLLMHYETLLETLIKTKKRSETIKILMNTFPKMDKNIVQTVLEEIPLYDGKNAISKWLSLINVQKDASIYYNDNVLKNKNQWVFSQSRIDNGIPNYILRPSSNFNPRENLNSDIVEIVNIKEKEKLPKILENVDLMSLPTKWGTKWNVFKINFIKPVKYTIDIIPDFVNWLSNKLKLPIKWDDVRFSSINVILKSLENKNTFILALQDPYLFNEYKLLYNKKYLDPLLLWDNILSKESEDERKTTMINIFKSKTLWPMDIDILNMSKLLNINILLIHRGDYGSLNVRKKEEGEIKRGDLTDKLLSSSLTRAPYNWKSQILIILYKDKVTDNHNIYHTITSNNILLFNYDSLPSEITKLIKYHIDNSKKQPKIPI